MDKYAALRTACTNYDRPVMESNKVCLSGLKRKPTVSAIVQWEEDGLIRRSGEGYYLTQKGVDLLIDTMPRSFKIDRHCPRCRAHRYHWYRPAKETATCAECGHDWHPRIFKARDLGEDTK